MKKTFFSQLFFGLIFVFIFISLYYQRTNPYFKRKIVGVEVLSFQETRGCPCPDNGEGDVAVRDLETSVVIFVTVPLNTYRKWKTGDTVSIWLSDKERDKFYLRKEGKLLQGLRSCMALCLILAAVFHPDFWKVDPYSVY
jgi:hypothetical protein